MTELDHRVKGVDHAAFPTFDPAGTVRFYRDVLGFPVVHSICAVGWGPEDHPDFIHFFFDIGNDDRIAFFYYFGFDPVHSRERGDAYAGFGPEVPEFFVRSRHLAIHVENADDLLEYRRRLDDSAWPVEMQIKHETIESIYTHDPNGYLIEITMPLRPVTPQEDLDANLTIDALLDVVAEPDPTFGKLLARKAELIVDRAAAWEPTLDFVRCAPRVTVPTLFIELTGDQAAFPADSRRMIDALGAKDLTTATVRGLHFGGPITEGEPTGNELAAAEIFDWLSQRHELAPPA